MLANDTVVFLICSLVAGQGRETLPQLAELADHRAKIEAAAAMTSR